MIDEWALRDDLASTFGREIDLVKKRYITTELQDRLAEMQRVIFVNSITSNPMFRIDNARILAHFRIPALT